MFFFCFSLVVVMQFDTFLKVVNTKNVMRDLLWLRTHFYERFLSFLDLVLTVLSKDFQFYFILYHYVSLSKIIKSYPQTFTTC